MKIILASKSPRRKEILEMAGYEFEVKVSNADENIKADTITEMSLLISKRKCDAVFSENQDSIIISADTIVVIDNKVLEKPKSKDNCREMIKMIQNNVHEVYTSVVVKSKEKEVSFLEKTKVYVGKMTDEEIEEYINTNEPYDKAGGYAIQGIFGKYIEKIEGDYYNVMGLPIYRINQVLKVFLNK